MSQLERMPTSPLGASPSESAPDPNLPPLPPPSQPRPGRQPPGFNALPARTQPAPPLPDNGLDAYRDAREIVRLAQCPVCSLPLRSPMALPCGNSFCQQCMPKTYKRESITWPNIPGRLEAFECPIEGCRKEHSVADCAVDFTLRKVMDIVEEVMVAKCSPGRGQVEGTTTTVLRGGDDAHMEEALREQTTMGTGNVTVGRLARTFAAAKQGDLLYHAEIEFDPDAGEEAVRAVDTELLRVVKANTYSELECQVCCALLLDPLTTPCGHTFCRKCLQRVLDHSPRCPTCRRTVQLPAVLPAQSSNLRLTEILVGLCPDLLAQRADAVATEEKAGSVENSLATPIFVCAASLPGAPTPLFIFEPKYRLMIRRAWEDNRRFGMVLPNRFGEEQGELGVTPFMKYGTMLEILDVNLRPDGTSDVWTVGSYKFEIRRWGMRDDYYVADIDRLDDIPIAEEEAAERLETSLRLTSHPQTDFMGQWNHLSTQALLDLCYQFVQQCPDIVTTDNIMVFGQPPYDAAMLPYWMASVMPVHEQEKYRLIMSTSVRERMKIVVSWIKRIESHPWYRSPGGIKLLLYLAALLIGVLGILLRTVL